MEDLKSISHAPEVPETVVPVTVNGVMAVASLLEAHVRFMSSWANAGKPIHPSTMAAAAAAVEQDRRTLLSFAGLNPDYTPA